MFAIVEYVDRFTGEDILGEFDWRHVGSTPGAIYGKEAQSCSRDVI
jgi:hypothetical protein